MRVVLLASLVFTALTGCSTVKTDQPDLEGKAIQVTFVHTTDIHSRLIPYDMEVAKTDQNLGLLQENAPFGGIARIAYIAREIRAKANRSLHIDTGDSFQGAPIFNVFQGEVELRAFSMMGLDVMAIGNHEFDSGEPNVADKIVRFANFPVLAGNYLIEASMYPQRPPLEDLIEPYQVFNLQGLRVGVVGLGNTSSMNTLYEAGNKMGITPIEDAEATQAYIDIIRPRVDVVVIASHLGLTADEGLIGCISGADLVLGGHHHVVLNPPKKLLSAGECHYDLRTRFSREVCESAIGPILRPDEKPDPAELNSACSKIASEMERLFSLVTERPGQILPVKPEEGFYARCVSIFDRVVEVPDSVWELTGAERNEVLDAITDNYASALCYGLPKTMGYTMPERRDVPLAHSGAFAKYVGKFEAVFKQAGPCADELDNDNDGLADLADPDCSDEFDGSEVEAGDQECHEWDLASYRYEPIPVDKTVPEDEQVAEMLEPYVDRLQIEVNLDMILGYAPVTVTRYGMSKGDSALGNMVAEAMQRRPGVETDFAMTNSLGIRSDLSPGPITVEEMFNVFPFENSITTMYLSGREVLDVFDFVARRSAGRGCQAQAQIAGAEVGMQCGWCDNERRVENGLPPSEEDVEGCAVYINIAGQPLQLNRQYQVAVNDYIAAGGSGFLVLKRNTTKINTGIQQRDALIDSMRAGRPCGASADGALKTCVVDSGDGGCPAGFVCSCEEKLSWNFETGTCDRQMSCGEGGACVLEDCVIQVAELYIEKRCMEFAEGPLRSACMCRQEARAMSQCEVTACIDDTNGVGEDGRLTMYPP